VENLKIIAKGAEADLFFDPDWNGKRVIIKQRNVKKYRHHELDALIRRYRTIHEAQIIHRAKNAGVPTPIIYQVDPEKTTIVMEFIEGKKVRDIVAKLEDSDKRRMFAVIGCKAGCLHRAGIIHGDLTTSNIIKTDKRIVFIDFGLAELSSEMEKRGVDLNLMNRMLASTHFVDQNLLLNAFKEGYLKAMGSEGEGAWRRMEEIALRGRYTGKE
jgi:TP53 regulating kinase-like protein